MTTHHLGPGADTCVGSFDRSDPPALTVVPGDRLVVATLDAHGYLEPPERPGWTTPSPGTR